MNRKRQSASLSDVRAQKIVLQKLCGLRLFLVMTSAAATPGSTEAAEHNRKIAGIISEVMIESSTEHDLLYGPSIADAPKASLKDHTGRGAAGLCEDRPRPNRRKNAANETVRSVWSG